MKKMLTPINECVMEKQSNNCLSNMSLAQISHLHSRKIICSTQTLFIMLPSHAIRHFLFPTYEVVNTSLSYLSALMSEIIKCSIPLVDNHLNIHRAINAVC